MTPLPPLLLTSEPGSFARKTFEQRIPRIVDELCAANDFSPDILANLRALRDEITHGTIRPLVEDTPDKNFWNDSARPHLGKTWLDVPWFWAETFFYRRVLEATRYFQHRRDPFANQKQRELDAALAPLASALANLPRDHADAFRALLHASLWGNRIDLSMWSAQSVATMREARQHERDNLIVDDTARVWEHLTFTPAVSLKGRGSGRVDFICDNAGTELCFDLAFADFLLRANLAAQIVLHLKPQPYFVSDAMIPDVEYTLDTLAQSDARDLRELAARIRLAQNEKRMFLTDHPFWTTHKFFRDLDADLRDTLAHARLVISKGDANYRRLVGDCHWDLTTPFASAVDYFPAPVVAARTLKAELIVGMRGEDVERLRTQDAEWMVNGKRGVIQFWHG